MKYNTPVGVGLTETPRALFLEVTYLIPSDFRTESNR